MKTLLFCTAVHLSVIATARYSRAQEASSPDRSREIPGLLDGANEAVTSDVFASGQKAFDSYLTRSADLQGNLKALGEKSIAQRALEKSTYTRTVRETRIAGQNLRTWEQGVRMINVLGPLATAAGTLYESGSLTQAGIDGLNDFSKFWMQDLAGGVGAVAGAGAGPAGSATGALVASQAYGKLHDATVGKFAANQQQQVADADAILAYIPPDKQRRFRKEFGPHTPEPPNILPKDIRAIVGDNARPRSTTSGPGFLAPAPSGSPPPADPLGPRPASWPENEPWPPSVDKLLELVNKDRADSANASPAGQSPPAVAATAPPPAGDSPPVTPPPATATDPAGGSEGDFTGPGALTDTQPPGAGSAAVAEQPGSGGAAEPFDASGFARGQQKADQAAAARVEGDYAEASRLENALQAAETEFRRATAEAQRVAAQKRAASEAARQAAENATAQRKAYEAYTRWLAQKRAYSEWAARQAAQQRASQRVPQRTVPQHSSPGKHPSKLLIDPPR